MSGSERQVEPFRFDTVLKAAAKRPGKACSAPVATFGRAGNRVIMKLVRWPGPGWSGRCGEGRSWEDSSVSESLHAITGSMCGHLARWPSTAYPIGEMR